LLSVFLWSFLFSIALLFAVTYGYIYRKDRDKRKLMFMLAFAFASFGYLAEIQSGWEGIQALERLLHWSVLPLMSSLMIAVFSSLLNLEDFDKPFKIFLLTLVGSIFMMIFPLPIDFLLPLLFQGTSTVVIAVSIYLYVTRRELSDLIFLLSMVCFTSGGLGMAFDLGIPFTVFSYAIAYVLIGIVFMTSSERATEGIAPFFSIKRELEKTQQELEISQDQLMRAEDKFKSLVNFIADPVVIIDNKGHILEINEKVVELTGFSKEELLGKNFLQIDMLTMKSKAIAIKSLAKRMMGIDVKSYEIEANTKSGEALYLDISAQKIEYENKSADLVIFHDITERKMMKEKLEKYAEQLEEKVKERTKTLKENEEKLRSMFNSSPDAIAVSDLKRNIIECNKATLDFLGLSTKDEIIGKNSLIFVAKKDRQKVRKTMNNVLKMSPLINVEYAALNKDGYEFPAEFSASAIKDSSGNPTGFMSIIKDITERKKREDELYKSETKNIAILNAIPDLMWRMNKDGVFLEFIPTKDFPTLIPPEQILGKNIHDVAPKWFAQKTMQYAKQAFQTNEIQIFEYQLPSTLGSDNMHDYEARLVVGGEDEILSIVRDITERKRMENELRRYSEQLEELVEERTIALKESQERLVKTERLAAIGQAATMVGHDLRNPLQAIENGIYYINTELSNHPISQKTTEILQAIHNSVDYADNIVKGLQSFASKREPLFMEIDINTLVKETFSHFKQPENVETIMELGELPKIEADKDMMKRIFVNLAVNGIQAMNEKRGILIVSTKETNGCIEVKFKDTGIGIKEENMDKLFIPFFTTKAQGMGVGLSICKRFAEIHDGSIKVESEEGKGSIFTVKLPIQRNGGVKRD